jgi:tetratricopeptide (TPR) repeat protein
MKYFRKIVETEPRNAAALNNIGNLHMIDGRYPDAQKSYADAAKADPKDAEILVNLANSFKAVNNVEKAKEAFSQAQRIDPSMASKYKALGLELMNSISSTKASSKTSSKAKSSVEKK